MRIIPCIRPLLFALGLLLAACSPARREIGHNMDAVRHIRFTGNGSAFSGQNDLQLEQQLEQQDSRFGLTLWPLMYWVDPVTLDPEQVLRDSYRLEVWYAHHGWFDAQVTGWEIRRVRKQGVRRGGVVDIRGILDPGDPSFVSTLSLTGLDKPRHVALKEAWRRSAVIRSGDQFDLEVAEADRRLLLDLLYGVGFPYARVDLEIAADPAAHEVGVTLAADTGEHSRFGEARVIGNDRVTDEQIASRLTFEPGKEFNIDRLRETQAALFEMGTFSSVRVVPDTSDPTQRDVPIDVYLSESKWRSLRVGFGSSVQKTNPEGLLTDGLAWSPRLSTEFRHANLFRQLIAWELRASVGIYFEPEVTEGPNDPAPRQTAHCLSELAPALANALNGDPTLCPHILEPTWMLGTSWSWPRILGEHWGLENDIQIERDVFLGAFPLRNFATSLFAVHQPSRTVQLRLGPSVEQAEYFFETDVEAQRLQRVYGNGFENPYVLVALDQELVVDRRQVKRRTKTVKGLAFASWGLRETLPTHPTAQRFVGVDTDNRFVMPVPVSKGGYALESAFAVRGQWQIPYSDRDVAYPERGFLGGATSVRGFRTGQLGPYVALWNPDRTVTYLPLGGNLALESSAEVRYPWLYGITWATFVDAGALAETPGQLGFDDVRASAGVGFRYDTVVGPVRLDVSFRPLYPEDRSVQSWLPETAGRPPRRSYDLISGLFPGIEHPDFAVVLFLAIGEAI